MHSTRSKSSLCLLIKSCTIALTIIALGNGCSSAPKRGGEGERFDESLNLKGKEGVEYKEAQATFSQGDYAKAITKLLQIEKRYPKSENLPYVRNLKGLAYLMQHNQQAAVQWFRRALDTSTSRTFQQYVLYNLASAQNELGQYADARLSLTKINPEVLDRETRLKHFALSAKVALRLNQPSEAVRVLLELSYLNDTKNIQKSSYVTLLEQALQDAQDSESLIQVLNGRENAPWAEHVLFRLGQIELAQSRMGTAEKYLNMLVEQYPNSQRALDAMDLLRAIHSQGEVNSLAVGVLLPMTGKYAKFGQRSLQGIQLAFGIFSQDSGDHKVTLVTEDSGEDAETTIRALDTLVFKHKVVAVIGPLLSKGIDQVAQRAQELGVPLLSLAQAQPEQVRDYLISFSVTPQQQSRSIADYAVKTLGIKRFAVLFPSDRTGQLHAFSFWDEVESLGGQIVGAENYNAAETDFRYPIDRISGLAFEEARGRELEELAKLREENEIKKRNRKTEKFYALTPIVDYQAVYIPDEPKVVGQILPTFAYRDIQGVKFFGNSNWHSPELLSRAESYADGAVFVDAYFPQSAAPVVTRFISRFKAAFGQEPATMEAIAYDAGSVLDSILTRNVVSSRSQMKDYINNVRKLPGVTGTLSLENGFVDRTLNLIEISNNRFQLISSAK